jgi:hypothetical protein
MTSVTLVGAAFMLLYFSVRGRGFRGVPHKGNPPEISMLGFLPTMFTAYVRFCRGLNAITNG